MTASEADQAAARLILELLARRKPEVDTRGGGDAAEIDAAVGRIEAWLRRRAVGNDRLTVQRMERPIGRQVQASRKEAKRLGIPEGGKE